MESLDEDIIGTIITATYIASVCTKHTCPPPSPHPPHPLPLHWFQGLKAKVQVHQ